MATKCLTCNICCRFPEKNSPLIPFFMAKERGEYYGCRVDVIKHADGYICPYFLPEKNRCSIYEKRPLDCRLYPFMVTYDESYRKVILVLDNHCPYANPVRNNPDEHRDADAQAHRISNGAKEFTPIEITKPDIGFINDPQPNTTFVKELPELTEFLFEKTGRFRKLRLEDGLVIPYLWKDIINVLYEEDTGEVYYNFRQYTNNDYIYLKKDLVELKGDRYKNKRNLCNYFERNYSYKVERLIPQDEHLCLYKNWAENKLEPYQKQLAEDSFFFHRRAFIDFNRLGLEGIEIRIDDRLAGYTFGFGKDKTFYILGEIADRKYKGINQFIFWRFCRILPNTYIYINTMDDSEIPGLRQNKLSYRPVHSGFFS